MDALISVIIPVYKVESYIHKCIDSVLNQSYPNLQIILVDDGSPDNCPAICDEYARMYNNIIVIHKKNGGLSDARNVGIEVATGEYIAFLDSDDSVHKDMYLFLYQKILEHSADISICSYKKVYENVEIEPLILNYKEPDIILNAIEAIEGLLIGKNYGSVMAWNKLYKTKIIKNSNARYPVGYINEDVFTTYKWFYECNKIVYSNIPLYLYLQRDASIMGTPFSPKNLDAIRAAGEIHHFVSNEQLPLVEQVECYSALTYINLINKIIREKSVKENAQYLKKFREKVLKNNSKILKNKYLSVKHKVGVFCLILGYWLYTPMCNLFFGYLKKGVK